MNAILTSVRQELLDHGDAETLAMRQRFFKEPIRSYGVKATELQKIAKRHLKRMNHLPKTDVWTVCEALWKSGNMDEALIACNWSYALRKQFDLDDFWVFAHWISRYVDNWAVCDTLCNHSMGAQLEMYPAQIHCLKEFAEDENRWMRRASAVSLIIPARKGKFLSDVLDIAAVLLEDEDDLVQKGYGWMLKAACFSHEQEIFEFVFRNKQMMPRTALRYAIEKMPPGMKKEAMARDVSDKTLVNPSDSVSI